MMRLAQEIIDWTEIYVLDVQPLTAWQRWQVEQMFAEEPHGPE